MKTLSVCRKAGYQPLKSTTNFTLELQMPSKLKSTRTLQINSSKSSFLRVINNAQNKVIVIMGPTGAGKSRLSIDLATRICTRPEIINSDKIQVYQELDITTNKIPMLDRVGIPHHLLGQLDPTGPEFTPPDFRLCGSSAISAIQSESGIPIVVGGSNSFIYALLAKQFDQNLSIFSGSDPPDPVYIELRYNCCFLCLDVSMPILKEYLNKRVDIMLEMGMFDELSEFYKSDMFDSVNKNGLKKAIGVPEFEKYFKRLGSGIGNHGDDGENKAMYEEAIREIKENTRRLAERQVEKIQRLRDAGWDIQKIDATDVFKETIGSGDSGRVSSIWEKQVLEPSINIVKAGFLGGEYVV